MPRRPKSRPPIVRVLVQLYWLAATAWLVVEAPAVSAAANSIDPDPTAPRLLAIEAVRFEGMTRTRERVALAVAGVGIGDRLAAGDLQDAADRLARSHLFRSATVRAVPGTRRGAIELVFVVEENRPHLRFGVGYEDLGGWFLEPVQLNLDNLTGRGEEFDLSFRFGTRSVGAHLDWRMSSPLENDRYWGFGLHSESRTGLYYSQGAEIGHEVRRVGAEWVGGVPLRDGLALRFHAGTETITPDSTAKLHADASDGRKSGARVEYPDLPEEIQPALERRERLRLGAEFVLDRRIGRGLEKRGAWGRTGYDLTLDEDARPIHSGQLDARAYVPLGGIQVAARGAFETVSASALFYDRPYLGGLYSLRGYPSHALSPAGGDLRLGTLSVEFRTAWWGSLSDPRVVGLAFADAGYASGGGNETELSFGIGYGWRIRVPLLGRIGLDVGIPLSDAPVEEAFHPNLSLGWTY